MAYKYWTDDEWSSLLQLLKTHSRKEAFKIHAENVGRNKVTVKAYFYKKKDMFANVDINNSKRKNWTEKERKDLLKLIEQHPHNFNEAYRKHAKKYQRTYYAVANYFSRYRLKEDAKTCMMTVGKRKHLSPNRKNIYKGTKETLYTVKQSKWKRVLSIIFE